MTRDGAPDRRWRRWMSLAIVPILLALVAVLALRPTRSDDVDYSTASHWIRDGKVTSVELSNGSRQRDALERRVARLLERETLERAELVELLGASPTAPRTCELRSA